MPGEEFNFSDREVVLRADLSSFDERDCVSAPMRFILNGPRSPEPGERVVLVDPDEGSTCVGQVISIAGWEAWVRPDWETWSGVSKPPAGYMLH